MRSTTLLRAAIMLACTAATAAHAEDASAEKTTVSGRMYADLTHIKQESNGATIDPTGTGFDVKRFYLGVDHKFDDIWSINVTTDFNYVSGDGETQVYIKKAYIKAKFDDAFAVSLGSTDLPWVPFVEGLYGYRYLENVMIDHTKFGTSADWGLHTGGKFADGVVNYAVAIVNGNGYKNPSRSKTVDVEGRLSIVPVNGLTLALGFYNGKLGGDTEAVPAQNTAQRIDALAAYVGNGIRAGVEYFQAKNGSKALVQSATEDKASGYSGWFSYNFTKQFAAFARYDQVKPNKDTAADKKNTYMNLGVSYSPRKNVDFALAYKQDKTDGTNFSTSNGTIGGGTNPAGDGKYSEVGIWAAVQF